MASDSTSHAIMRASHRSGRLGVLRDCLTAALSNAARGARDVRDPRRQDSYALTATRALRAISVWDKLARRRASRRREPGEVVGTRISVAYIGLPISSFYILRGSGTTAIPSISTS